MFKESRVSKIKRESVLSGAPKGPIPFTYTPPPLPSFYLYSDKTSINEGESVTFLLSSDNAANGYSVPFQITGISSSDLVGAPLLNNFFIINNNISSITYTARADVATEGDETLRLTLTGPGFPQFVDVIIVDSSKTPFFDLYPDVPTINEGEQITFTLETQNVADGTNIPYQVSGQINGADLAGSPSFVGNFVVNGGFATITFAARADATTEGNETIRVTLTGPGAPLFAEATIIDTSLTPPDYTLYSNKAFYNEGEVATFILETEGVSVGQIVPFEITGTINPADLDSTHTTSLTGLFVVQPALQTTIHPAGSAFMQYKFKNDVLLEGLELMTATLKTVGSYTCPTEAIGKTCTVQINDTSFPAPSYYLTSNLTTANETTLNTIVFSLSAKDIPISQLPKTVPFVVTGVSPNDFVPGTSLNGTFVLPDNETIITKTFKVIADSTTEGTETMVLTLQSHTGIACPLEAQGQSKSVQILDTSTFPPGYTVSIIPAHINETTNNVFDVKLTTTGVNNGTIVPFRIHGTGISTMDFTSTPVLTGHFVVSGATSPFADLTPVTTSKTYTVFADGTIEGPETLNVTLTSVGSLSCPTEAIGATDQAVIEDTSKPNLFVSYLFNANHSQLHFDLSDSTSTLHFAGVPDGDVLDRMTTEQLSQPLTNSQLVSHIITNDSTDIVSKTPLFYTGTSRDRPLYNTNILGSGLPGLTFPGDGYCVWMSYTANPYINNFVGDFTQATNSFTVYIVYQYQYSALASNVIVRSLVANSTAFSLYDMNNYYQVQLGSGAGLYSHNSPTFSSGLNSARVLGFSVNGTTNKIAWADGNGMIAQENDTQNRTWVFESIASNDLLRTCFGSTASIANTKLTSQSLAELHVQSGYTTPTNLQTQVNLLKTKWGI